MRRRAQKGWTTKLERLNNPTRKQRKIATLHQISLTDRAKGKNYNTKEKINKCCKT